MIGAGVEERVASNEASEGASRPSVGHDAPCDATQPDIDQLHGLDGLIEAVVRYSAEANDDALTVIRRLGEDFAFIRWQDVKHPLRFLRQMAGNPPIVLGVGGFRKDLVDDANPARHYIAFVVVGYWLPRPLADGVLWMWEVAGFVRYGGKWSQPDVASGFLGIRHGRQVRREGVEVLPGLLVRDLAELSPDGLGSA